MHAEAGYATRWQSFRRLRTALLILVVAWIPYGWTVFWFARHFGVGDTVKLILMLSYILLMMVIGYAFALWRCPRCGKSFRGLRPYAGKSCYYCHLPKWLDSPIGPSPSR
jgi:hypothetical protein